MADKEPLPINFDFDAVDADAQEQQRERLPYFQWHHGNSDLEELGDDPRYRGGFLFNTRQKHTFGDEVQLPGFNGPIQIKLGTEKQPCLFATSLKAAVLRRRFCWITKDENGRERLLSAKGRQKQDGWKGRTQLLIIPAGVSTEEARQYRFVITGKSSTGANFNQACRDHNDHVVPVANRTVPRGKPPLPSYAFYTHFSTSAHMIVGEGDKTSEATYPILMRPKDVTREHLATLYIGRENLIEFQQIWKESEEWAHAWDTDQGVAAEFSTANPADVWAATDDQVSSFVKMSAMMRDRGMSLPQINKLACELVNVADIHHATPGQMNQILTEMNSYLAKHDHDARMALQAPSKSDPFEAEFPPPTDEDIPFDKF